MCRKDFSDLISTNENCATTSKKYDNYTLSILDTSAFVDIDSDCRNDLLIVSTDSSGTRSLEIWRGLVEGKGIKYCLNEASVYELDNSLGQFSVADFDRDGFLDLIFPVLGPSPGVLIVLNKNVKEYDWSSSYCPKHKTESFDKLPRVFDEISITRSDGKVNANKINFLVANSCKFSRWNKDNL